MVVYSQVLLACVAVLLFPGQAAQPLFAVLVMAVYAVGTIKLQPYLLNSDDIAASFANVGLWLTSLYSTVFQTFHSTLRCNVVCITTNADLNPLWLTCMAFRR